MGLGWLWVPGTQWVLNNDLGNTPGPGVHKRVPRMIFLPSSTCQGDLGSGWGHPGHPGFGEADLITAPHNVNPTWSLGPTRPCP